MRNKIPRLTQPQLALLHECSTYSISIDQKRYYRIGGSGFAPIRFNDNTMRVLEKKGMVEYKGYWTATEAGKERIGGEK